MKTMNRILLAMVLMFAAISITNVASAEVKSIPVQDSSRTFQKDKAKVKQSIKKQVSKLDGSIKKLQVKMNNSGEQAKTDYQRVIADLQDEKEKLNVKSNEVEATTQDKWTDFKTGVNETTSKLNAKLKRAGQNVKDYFNN